MKNIVIIAHDVKKPEMVQFLNDRKDWIFGVNLIATGRTAEYVESQGIKVQHLSPGKSGGYVEITDMIKQKEVDIVIFLRDPLIKQGHHEDIQALLEACNMYNIPLATNYASAELMILGQIKKEDYERRKSMDS
ncbi:MAG: methylglyoxal synthase [Bacteroidetes bacterium]|jgi:methylglyoxal synthase|nr:methylglyoxal synthase [Bacteroidota bacterium]